MQKEADRIVESLNIVEELENRGCKGRAVGDNFSMCCPFHDDKNPSFGVKISGTKAGVYNCLSCGARGGFLKLLAHLDGVSYAEILQRYSTGEVEVKAISGIKKKLFKALDGSRNRLKIKIIREKFLENFERPTGKYIKYLKERGIAKESIEKFKILCCTKIIGKLDWRKRVVIPVRDTKGRLVGLTARSIKPNVSKGMKVRKLLGSGVRNVLFGLHELDDRSTLVLVEGEMDCIYLQQLGVPAVCIGRKNISQAQALKVAVFADEAVVSLDGDASKDDVRRVKDKLKNYLQVSVVKLPKKLDPNELSKQEVKILYLRWAT